MPADEIGRRATALYDVIMGDKQGIEVGTFHEIISRHLASAVNHARPNIVRVERPPFVFDESE